MLCPGLYLRIDVGTQYPNRDIAAGFVLCCNKHQASVSGVHSEQRSRLERSLSGMLPEKRMYL